MSNTRLSPDKWIDAGFTALVNDGPTALAAEPLARTLGTTKGSFYWHFKDVPAFHAALIRHWHAQALADVVVRLQTDAAADTRLRNFARTVLADPTEAALRVWAHHDKLVAEHVAEVDAERLLYVQHLLKELGLRNPAFAFGLLAALNGLPQTHAAADPQAAFDALVDTVLALT